MKANEYELDRKAVEIENLEIQREELSSEDGLRSAAIGLGYQVETDDVYVFSSEDQVGSSSQKTVETENLQAYTDFKPWSSSFTLLISFCASTIITVMVWLFSRHKGKTDGSEQEESGDIGDYFDDYR